MFNSSYGAVHKAIHKKTGHVVAVKIVPIENDLESTIKEINVMNEFHSPSIVQFHGSFLKEPDLWVNIHSAGFMDLKNGIFFLKNNIF